MEPSLNSLLNSQILLVSKLETACLTIRRHKLHSDNKFSLNNNSNRLEDPVSVPVNQDSNNQLLLVWVVFLNRLLSKIQAFNRHKQLQLGQVFSHKALVFKLNLSSSNHFSLIPKTKVLLNKWEELVLNCLVRKLRTLPNPKAHQDLPL